MKKPIAWLILLLPFLLLSCSRPKDLQYITQKNIRVEQNGFTDTRLGMDLVYYNPNGYAIELKKADVDVFVEDRYFGHSSLDSLFEIPKLDTFTMPVWVKVDTRNVLGNALGVLGMKEVKLRLEGTAKVGRSGFFMTIPVKYEGMQQIRLFQ